MSEPRYAWLPVALADSGVVITASRRLARELLLAYNEQQVSAGRKAWPTASIFFWQDWLSRQQASAPDPASLPRPLDAFSSSVLWERCLVRRMPDGLLSLSGIVRQSGEAWQRICDWRLSASALLAAAQHQDERLFARTAADYRERLSAGNWVDYAGVADQVAQLFRSGQGVVPTALTFAGFDRFTPAALQIRELLTDAGCRIIVRPPPQPVATPSVACFDEETHELRAAGAWARQCLLEDPRAMVGIVVPGLESHAPDVARLVREGLVPGAQYGDSRYLLAANVSYGRRLSEYPAIAIALLVLKWTCKGISSRELSVLLRSRCVAGNAIAGRSRFELKLRAYPDREWSAENVLKILENHADAVELDSFVELLHAIARFSDTVTEKATPAECVSKIDALLNALQWPGAGSLDSTEFQLVNRWRELLNEFARVDSVLPQLDLSEAIFRVTTLAQEAVWQPEAEAGIVQVLGTLEAAGMEFDALWVCGLDATQWPPHSRPSPFIPMALQREQNMPDATPGDTLEFSRRVLARLAGSARRCVFSWARFRDDSELTASTLLEEIETKAYDGPGDPGWYVRRIIEPANSILEAGDAAPPVGPDERISGGAYTVQRQHEEPFSAFVAGRLGVRPLDPITIGLSASTRGSIIHNALHNLLSDRSTQQTICGWRADTLEQRIGSAVDSALAIPLAYANPVLQRIIGIERGRLQQLLREFLKAERHRPEFAVAAVEKKVNYEKLGIRLGLRIDRVDRLVDGRLFIIDYKTGNPKTLLGRDGELKDLQLIVYADALEESIGGLAIVNVDSREISYKAAGGGWNASDEAEWPAMFRSWQAIAHETLRSLAAGDIRINILQSANDGRALNILSRLEEQKRV